MLIRSVSSAIGQGVISPTAELKSLKPSGHYIPHSGHYMYRTVVTTYRTAVTSAHTVYLCVLHGSENKRRLFPYTALAGWFVQCVPLTTEPGISLIILPLMRILQRNLKRTYLIV